VRRIDPGRRRGVGAGSAGGSGRGPDTGCWSGWATSQDDMLRRMTASEHTFTYALDQRGHGRTADSTGPGRIGPRGTQGMIDDISELRAIATREFPDRSVVALGHSLGSLFVQAYVERHGADVAAYVLSGTMGVMPEVGELAAGIRQAVDAGMADEPLDMLGGFNGGFEPARTPFDWLSRDPDEVDRYLADPMCGDDNPLTYGYLIDLFEVLAPARDRLGSITCPVLVIAGDHDPAAAMGAHATTLADALQTDGVDVDLELYEGARHELLNETNRDEVTASVIGWLGSRVRSGGAAAR
jgi:alpha-beta hydrolase superfamily lysophospholipase